MTDPVCRSCSINFYQSFGLTSFQTITYLSKLHDAKTFPYLGWAQAIAHTGPSCALKLLTFGGLPLFLSLLETSNIDILPSDEHVANFLP